MKNLPESFLAEFVDHAEKQMQEVGGGNLAQNVAKIEKWASELGYSVESEKVRNALIKKLASETVKELKRQMGA